MLRRVNVGEAGRRQMNTEKGGDGSWQPRCSSQPMTCRQLKAINLVMRHESGRREVGGALLEWNNLPIKPSNVATCRDCRADFSVCIFKFKAKIRELLRLFKTAIQSTRCRRPPPPLDHSAAGAADWTGASALPCWWEIQRYDTVEQQRQRRISSAAITMIEPITV